MGIQKNLLVTASVLTVMACMGAAAHAQDAAPEAAATGDGREVIVVRGIRGALDQAVETKRNSDTIGEAISADDIGTLPALDLAEALQVVPGVQVNRENNDGAFRYGEISLRGLPGSFTNTTANGQSFASPSGSVSPAEGVPNAFGAFSSRVFDGVWVNKTSRADLVEGGIAGTVDQRLASALSKPDGQLVVSAGGQYEELPDDVVGNFFASGTKHLIEDRLGVTFRLAHEQESFRRDAFNFTTYSPLVEDAANRRRGGFVGANGESLSAWRTANGIAAADTVLIPTNLRQYAESREGYRTSFVGGVEFQATPELKLGGDILYSDRELDLDAQWVLVSPQVAANSPLTSITPSSDPFAAYTNEDGSTTWVLPGYDYADITYRQDERVGRLTQDAEGIFLDAEYIKDRWTFNTSLAYSEAEYIRLSPNYITQYQANTGNNFATNGTFGTINTGSGNSDNYIYSLNFDPTRTTQGTNLDLLYVNPDNPTTNSISINDVNGRQTLFVAGNEVFRNRTDSAVNFDAEREMNLGWLTKISAGGRYNEQSVQSYILEYSIAGLNTEGVTNALLEPGPGNFFGGGAPGAYRGSEWEFLDGRRTEEVLFEGGLQNPNGLRTSPYSGLIYRTEADGDLVRANQEATTDTTIAAFYAMADFEGALLGFDIAGNFGVRHIETDLEGEGFSTINGVATPATAETSYNNTLPALNVSVKLLEDLYLRFGYSQAMNRPNPAGFTPSFTLTEVDGNPNDPTDLGEVRISLPALDVDPYTSDNFDVALEWYNRRGSLLSATLYRRDVKAFISTRLVCPTDGGELGYGTLTQVDLGGGSSVCRIDADGRDIFITETYNFDSNITIDGIELAVQQNLDFLDNSILRGFGVQASASFLDTSGVDNLGNPAQVQQISDESYNLAGYWENEKLSARLAYNWRSEYFLLGIGSITGTQARQVAPRGQLDFIGRYDVTDNLTIDFRAFNILDVLYEEYQSDNPMMVRQTAYDGRTVSTSVTYRF